MYTCRGNNCTTFASLLNGAEFLKVKEILFQSKYFPLKIEPTGMTVIQGNNSEVTKVIFFCINREKDGVCSFTFNLQMKKIRAKLSR